MLSNLQKENDKISKKSNFFVLIKLLFVFFFINYKHILNYLIILKIQIFICLTYTINKYYFLRKETLFVNKNLTTRNKTANR